MPYSKAPAGSVPKRPPPGGPQFSLNPGAVADALADAVSGFGTDEEAVWRELGKIRSQGSWTAVQRAFRDRHPRNCGGDLKRALEDDLNKSEMQRAKSILARNGVSWDDHPHPQPQQPPPQGHPGGYGGSPASYQGASYRAPARHDYQHPVAPPADYDHRDRAPEDRTDAHAFMKREKDGADWLADTRLREFDLYDLLVRGSLIIDGVNYAKYEQARESDERMRLEFLDAIKDDLIGEVGNGVKREDIAIRIYPGQIKAVVLHYDKHRQREKAPALVDAEWSIRVDYAIRTRDSQRQRNIALSLYTTFRSAGGFRGEELKRKYHVLAGTEQFAQDGRVQEITVRCPAVDEAAAEAGEAAGPPALQPCPAAVGATSPPPPQPSPAPHYGYVSAPLQPQQQLPAPYGTQPRHWSDRRHTPVADQWQQRQPQHCAAAMQAAMQPPPAPPLPADTAQQQQLGRDPAQFPPVSHPAYGSNQPLCYADGRGDSTQAPNIASGRTSPLLATVAAGDPQRSLHDRDRELAALAKAIERERMLLRVRSGSLSPSGSQRAAGRRPVHSPRHAPQPPVVGTRPGDVELQSGPQRRQSGHGARGAQPPRGPDDPGWQGEAASEVGSYSTHEF
eukprot:TRINITY_DN60690_c0_g1_i1.p1 TRINITY_DN60690_c0_g1~~TRINITY_DN60690_c0_g1_i1.p1  ORF type:complete len:620 (+),score=150.28 TRINITY_DN60690_c0_g1_i1:118-1977(+)